MGLMARIRHALGAKRSWGLPVLTVGPRTPSGFFPKQWYRSTPPSTSPRRQGTPASSPGWCRTSSTTPSATTSPMASCCHPFGQHHRSDAHRNQHGAPGTAGSSQPSASALPTCRPGPGCQPQWSRSRAVHRCPNRRGPWSTPRRPSRARRRPDRGGELSRGSSFSRAR
jgi:hypothetical protein